ncbi:hypothetical protein JAAARDRAFT_127655 [Jaapia argillacea MUCL 33604]|uniref:Selenoprotein O n=1 Tax=Jaapia argillacea MUCL 33604 TaxID=933084 RepID=A0A067Q711_9AGAM|nr:hypothetical protein JAAARDRAFT_127655 [Jaapia argillacea MUCL 33604]
MSNATAPIKRFPISSLPLPPATHLVTHALHPDPATPSVSEFRNLLRSSPSTLRRSRILESSAHFTYVSPLPLPFPYQIKPEEGEKVEDQMAFVEKWLGDREALDEVPNVGGGKGNGHLKKLASKNREYYRELIGLSETGLRDCLPHLHVGDAFATLGTPTLAHEFDDEDIPTASDEEQAIRQELVDVLSGHSVLMTGQDTEDGVTAFGPWSLRYSGHQFGVWAGQLGDGRAISILSTPHPSDTELTYELQLKGAGRTPYSRSADGLAVLRSSIREFLCAEAMHALHIPTTRSLSLISLPHLQVLRERAEFSSVLTRVAPSFIRIGNFEAMNPPEGMMYLMMGGAGSGEQKSWEGLRVLGEWVAKRVLKLGGESDEPWGKKLVFEVARRNAKMVAGWQAYGFMHGVINTDNVSILGLTIDYGPFAFMDVFDPLHICNHSDDAGRYSYRAQPAMILYAAQALLNALAPLIGAEYASSPPSAVKSGWADGASREKIEQWTQKGKDEVEDELRRVVVDVCGEEYGRLMHKRLGLRRSDKSDEAEVSRPLLGLMEEHKLDFHGTFRKLCFFRPSWILPNNTTPTAPSDLDAYISALLSISPEADRMDKAKAAQDFKTWLTKYGNRVQSERDLWADGAEDEESVIQLREKEMKDANPRFVLRQWVLEEVIKKVERDAESGKRVLGKVLKMACSPYDPWGGEGDETTPNEELEPEIREERRFCGLGERKMIGFQCSCSS